MKRSKKDHLYDDILGRLIARQYRFGDDIQVKEIVAEAGASRQPVLAALNALAADGFVEIVPQVGCRVIAPTLRDITDFYMMFGRLEGLLAELAAARRTPAQLARIVEINRNIRDLRAAQRLSPEEYRVRNRDFHRTFHQMAGSDMVDTLHARFFDMSDFFIGQTVGFSPHVDEAVDEHDAIIGAISRQQPELARAAAESHIAAVAKTVAEGFQHRVIAAAER